MRRHFILACVFIFFSAQFGHAEESPYTDFESREIKALSSQQIEGYLAGHGMGRALAAELNGYPGPKHVLELADEFSLSPAQRRRISEVFKFMQSAAVDLGEKIVTAERALDVAFADNSISRDSLDQLVLELGAQEGRLRGVHLAAHLETKALLDPEQIHGYSTLRGYGGMDHDHMDHSQHR